MTGVDAQLNRTLAEVNALSETAKANGDFPTMYAANRAWHELSDASRDRKIRRASMAPAKGMIS